MKCSKCGSEITSQSRFCPSCGQPTSATTSMPQAEAPRKSTAVLGVVAGLAIVAALVLGYMLFKGRGVTQATGVQGPQAPVVKAPTPATGPQADVLKTDVKNQAPDLNAPEKTPPPQEVLDYLAHLKKVEERRMALKSEQEAELINMVAHMQVDPIKKMLDWAENPEGTPEKTSENEAKQAMKDFSKEWQELARFFVSVPAPEQCRTLATKYYDAMRDVVSTMADLQTILTSGDLGKAYQMQGKSGHIDDKLIAADQELGSVCTKYGIDKDFSIKSDTGVAPIMGLPTMPKP